MWVESETTLAEAEQRARDGELVVLPAEDRLAGCMFLQKCDPDYWPDDPPGEALYIHRLVVARDFAGRGLAHRMLAWAEERTREAGRPYVRLDCELRPKLIALYRTAGFVPVDPGPVTVFGFSVLRQQKRV
jgi:GNAT superfamily N-acetyltransferase